MSSQNTVRPEDHAWEKEFAPKVGRGRVMLVSGIYALFLLFLAAISVHRWFFSLQ